MNTITNNILKTINTTKYYHIFYNNTANRKYNIKLLVDSIVFILKFGVSYRSFIELLEYANMENNNNKLPSTTTIYNFYNKLKKYNIIHTTYNNLVNKYINKHKTNKFITDTTFINNKMGIDYINYNKQIPKHKVSKISLITDLNGIPLDINLSSGNTNDSKIFFNQLDNFININAIKKNNKNIFLGDAAYDSNNIRNKLKDLNLGILVVPKNKRNIKDINILASHKLNLKNKNLLKNRYKIEFTNNRLKQYKRINIRYDKFGINYLNYVYLAAIDLIVKD
jgi:transposase